MTDEIIEEISDESLPLPSETESNEILDSISIDKPETKVKVKIETPQPEVVAKQINSVKESHKSATVDETNEAKALYDDFSAFLEQKTEISSVSDSKPVIPTGIKILDAYMGGGFAIGALSIIVGTPGSGKSMLAAQVIANAQRIYEPGKFLAGYMDSEESTTQMRLASLGVVNPKLRPFPDITVEKVFKFLETMILYKEQKKSVDIPSIVVWDSIANTLSQKEREAEDVNQVIGYKARMLSMLIPKYVAKCSQYNICWLAVNQLRDKLDMGQFSAPADLKFMTSTKQMPGGQALKFNAFQLLQMQVKSAFDTEKGKFGFDGIIVKCKFVKNKLFVPNIEMDLVGSFVKGFSDFWTSYNFLTVHGRLKAGAWNYLVSNPDKKFRTKDAINMYNNDSEFRILFDAEVEKSIEEDIIDKYRIE